MSGAVRKALNTVKKEMAMLWRVVEGEQKSREKKEETEEERKEREERKAVLQRLVQEDKLKSLDTDHKTADLIKCTTAVLQMFAVEIYENRQALTALECLDTLNMTKLWYIHKEALNMEDISA